MEDLLFRIIIIFLNYLCERLDHLSYAVTCLLHRHVEITLNKPPLIRKNSVEDGASGVRVFVRISQSLSIEVLSKLRLQFV